MFRCRLAPLVLSLACALLAVTGSVGASRSASSPTETDVRGAIERAVEFMSTVPTSELHFDSALMLSQIRRHFDFPALDREFTRARTVADRDHDHPHRVLWVPDLEVPAKVTAGWTVPTGGGKRAKTNDPLSEAMHCKRNGFRPETLAYMCGAFRDEGGYYTTHGLWAVVLARDAGCVGNAETAECVTSLQAELLDAQPDTLAPQKALDTDLYAERLLTLVLSGRPGKDIDGFARELLAQQQPDGSFTLPNADEPPYYAYHATGTSAWALAEWDARRNQ